MGKQSTSNIGFEKQIWDAACVLRGNLDASEYKSVVLGLIFLRYAYSRFKTVEAEILKNRPMRGGRAMPVEKSDFAAKSALFLPKEAQYDYLLNLPEDVASANIKDKDGHIIKSLGEAIAHISAHSTGHSDCIVTEDKAAAAAFVSAIDSAAVYVNCSTRFTDGGEFGLGCEMGISTQKLHARGPMGLAELCTYKYIIRGDGQIRV